MRAPATDNRDAFEPRIQAVIDRFESQWKRAITGDAPPNLKDAVTDIEEPARSTVLESLVNIERKYRETLHSRGEDRPTQPGSFDATIDVVGSDPFRVNALQEDRLAETVAPTVRHGADPTDGNHPAAVGDDTATAEFIAGLARPSDSRRRRDRAPSSSDPPPTIPGYEIHHELGRGGMGVVYKARHHALKRVVALKMILAGSHASPDQLARFHAEAEAVAQLMHPNIVQVHDVGEHNGLPFFSLEFIDGHALSDEIEGQPVPPVRAAELVEVIARAMHHAHMHGIIHRDLKPANILLTRDGQPKVTDFGLVKRLEGDAGQTHTGAIMGTPRYMSPEQGRGEKDVGVPTDVYALGGILYCALTGRAPFVGATGMDTLMQLLHDDPVPLVRLQPGTPRDLDTICMKCLEKDPTKRYPSAEALAEDLRRFRAGEPIAARQVSVFERAWRWCKRNPRVAIPSSAAAALAIALAVGGPLAAMIVYQQKELAETSERIAVQARQVAQTNEQLAQASKQEAFEARDDAQRNEHLAREARNVAGQQGRVALDALADMVRKVQAELQNKSGMQPLRQSLLTTAMDHISRVNEFEVDENFRDALVASVYRRLGDVYLNLGNGPKSVDNYKKCYDVVTELHKHGNLPNSHHNLSDILTRLGQAEMQAGDLMAAKKHFLGALEIRREWEKADADNAYIRQNIAATLGHLGNVTLTMGRVDEAAKYFDEGLELRKSWVEWAPDSSAARAEYAGALEAVARVTVRRGEMTKAEQFIGEGTEVLADLLNAQPDNRDLKWNLALFRKQHASVQLLADKPQEASATFAQAVSPLEELSKEDPLNWLTRRHVAEAEYGLATALLELNDETAQEHFQRSLELRRQLVKDDPENPLERGALMLTLARVGKYQEAETIAEKMRSEFSDNAQLLYMLAAGYAVCSLNGSDNDELANHYGELAVSTLQQAVEHGYQVTADLGFDPDFDSLQRREDFRNLLLAKDNSTAFDQ
ncbi:MAG TPA: serine/threonine-protein kinase [Pirellulaceae bacterium]|nr:serine/threonine-protein kinase [Pirellulaceae bacterium]